MRSFASPMIIAPSADTSISACSSGPSVPSRVEPALTHECRDNDGTRNENRDERAEAVLDDRSVDGHMWAMELIWIHWTTPAMRLADPVRSAKLAEVVGSIRRRKSAEDPSNNSAPPSMISSGRIAR